MSLSKKDEKILQQIVDVNGKCLDSVRCGQCPFRGICLPEFLNPKPPTQTQRAKMALDVLTHDAILNDEHSNEEVQSSYEWGKQNSKTKKRNSGISQKKSRTR